MSIQRRKGSEPDNIKLFHSENWINIVKGVNHDIESFNLFRDCLHKMGRLN